MPEPHATFDIAALWRWESEGGAGPPDNPTTRRDFEFRRLAGRCAVPETQRLARHLSDGNLVSG